MQERRNIRLLISFVVLGISTIAFFFFSNQDASTIDRALFKVADQNKIDRVQLESTKGKVELKFDGVKWNVNSKYEADLQLVTIFFASLLQTEPKRKITGNQLDSVTNYISKKGVKVSLWEGESKAMEMIATGNPQRTETYFQLMGDDPYLVTIPGYRVDIASIFELLENDWREKKVFAFNWQNFKSLKAHFPRQKDQDFTVSLVNRLFTIEEVAVVDTTKLSGFLESVFNLKADRILTSEEKSAYDSLLATPPIAQLEIEDIAKKSFSIKIYQPKRGTEWMVGLNHREEAVLLSPRAAGSVLRSRNYFVLK